MTETGQVGREDQINKTDSHVETVVDDEMVLMDIEHGNFYSLTDTGKRIWELIDGPTRVDTLVERLTAEYDVAENECIEHLSGLLHDLQQRGLVTVTPA
ncbi:MAG: PqqD family protein [Pseudomonadota bacterium]